MAAQNKVVITGIGSIDRKLRSLPLKVQKKVVRQSMRPGMKIVAAAALALAPVLSGILKAHIVVKAGLQRYQKKKRAGKRLKLDEVSIDVRIDADAATKKTSKKTGETVFYPAVVEYKYDDFMLRAFRSAGDAARRTTLRLLKAGVEREAKGR